MLQRRCNKTGRLRGGTGRPLPAAPVLLPLPCQQIPRRSACLHCMRSGHAGRAHPRRCSGPAGGGPRGATPRWPAPPGSRVAPPGPGRPCHTGGQPPRRLAAPACGRSKTLVGARGARHDGGAGCRQGSTDHRAEPSNALGAGGVGRHVGNGAAAAQHLCQLALRGQGVAAVQRQHGARESHHDAGLHERRAQEE